VARYSQGQPVQVKTTVRDVTGALTDAGAISLTVSKPDATTQVYNSPTHDSLGTYHQDIPVADLGQIGHYQYWWTSTGAGAGESIGDFDVYDRREPAVLPLQDAKDQLNISQATTTYDAEIGLYVATIETSLESMTGGPLVNRTITERSVLQSWRRILKVRQRPLVSVTSITSVTGMAVDISAGLDISPGGRTARTITGYPYFAPFASDSSVVTVVYVAGWGTSVPPAFNLAARIILQHLWETQHGPSTRPSMAGADLATLPGFGFAVPNRAVELLNGSLNGLMFADQVFAA
jgi:hypothetical protein